MTYYRPLEIIDCTGPYGISESLDAMRLPKYSNGDSEPGRIGPNDAKLASALIRAGDDHAKAMRGIDIHLKIRLQVGFMIEFETYRYGVECLSTSSSMHGELKAMCGPELAEQKQNDLPTKVYTRRLKISYQALRRMYRARRKHRHPDWQIFCDFIEGLLHFNTLIIPEYKDK